MTHRHLLQKFRMHLVPGPVTLTSCQSGKGMSSSLPAQGTMGLHNQPFSGVLGLSGEDITQGEVQGLEVTGHNDELAPPGLETPTFPEFPDKSRAR